MSLRLSLGGVTALLALVAIHSSESVDPEASPGASDGRSKSKPEEDPMRALVPAWMRSDYDHAKVVISWRKNGWECSNGLESFALSRHKEKNNESFREQIYSALMSRRNFCFSRLEWKIQHKLDAMSESTREHFELFAVLDQRECTSEPGSLCFVFGTQNLVIGKLRRLAGSPEDAAAAKGFVSACKEVAGHERLATIRAKYEAATPLSTRPYFPHIRFYDYCRRLLDFDLLSAKIEGALKSGVSA
jgi:hypothetical protein